MSKEVSDAVTGGGSGEVGGSVDCKFRCDGQSSEVGG